MILPCPADHFLRKIHTNAAGRLQGCQQTTVGATNFDDPLPGGYMETINVKEAVVIPLPHAVPGIPFSGNGIPVCDPHLLVSLPGRVESRVCCCHRHDCTGSGMDWKGDIFM